MTTALAIRDLKRRIAKLMNTSSDKSVFVGFDGFVDKIKKAVKEKKKRSTIYYQSMQDFANRIAAAEGKSGQIQMDILQIKAGGNAPILAHTLGNLGVKTVCVGSMGYPEKHAVFSKMNPLCKPISVLNPGLTDAIEFAGGKFMFSELQMFDQYDWDHVKQRAGIYKLQSAVSSSTLVACVDWANLPNATNIWKGLLTDIIKKNQRKDFLFLFDLCDPSKKTTDEIVNALDLIAQFSPYGKVTLGLNENETLKIWAALNGADFQTLFAQAKLPSVRIAGEFIFKHTNIDTLLVHPIDRCLAFRSNETFELQGRLVTKPKVLTGGGDNLNAGYCLGLIHGLATPECLLLGMAASGSYIENGSSPAIEDITRYLNIWINDLEENTPEKLETNASEVLKIP
jgi:hypothetical protein